MKLLHPGIQPNCTTCQGTGYRVERDGEWARAVACACIGPCPHCRGTGWRTVGEGARPAKGRCECGVLHTRIQAFNSAQIPARHANSTLLSFDSTGPRMPAFMAVAGYLKAFDPSDENPGMVLHGDVGRGKTHLLVAMIRELIFTTGVTARFVEFSHLVGDIKAGFDKGRGGHSLLEPLVRVDILAIDELGKGRNTEFEGTVVDELVSRRYNAARPILGTTNYAPGAPTGNQVANFAANQQPTMPDRVGDRVYSRLREMCRFVPCTGDDYRERRRNRS